MRFQLLLVFVMLCLSGFIFGQQNDLIVFSSGLGRFTLYLNGDQVNPKPMRSVRVNELPDQHYQLKIVMDSSKLTLEEVLHLDYRGKHASSKEFSYSLITEKEKLKLKFLSMTDARHNGPDCQINDPALCKIDSVLSVEEKQTELENKKKELYALPGQCVDSVKQELLAEIFSKVKAEHFQSPKMREAKWFVSRYCLSNYQLFQLVTLFDYENSKMELLKFAYDYALQKDKYLVLQQVFKFQTAKEEFKNFVMQKRK